MLSAINATYSTYEDEMAKSHCCSFRLVAGCKSFGASLQALHHSHLARLCPCLTHLLTKIT